MARKRKSDLPGSAPEKSPRPYACSEKAEWGGFVNIHMTDQLKGEFAQWFERRDENPTEMLVDILARGAKFSLSWDDENECFIATLTGALFLSVPNMRTVCTSRSDNVNEALALLVYKHYYIVGGDYTRFAAVDSKKYNWG